MRIFSIRHTSEVLVLATTLVALGPARARADLVAHYRFDGNGQDVTTNAQTAREAGNVTYVAGVRGMAVNLAGDGGHFEIDQGPVLDELTGSMSTVFWMKRGLAPLQESFPFCKRMPYIGDQALADMSMHFCLKIDPGWAGSLTFAWSRWQGSWPGYTTYSTPAVYDTLNDGSWHMLALTHRFNSTDEPQLYLDGQRLPMTRFWDVGNAAAAILESKLWIGGQPVGPSPGWFNGQLDELRFYDHILSDADIARLFGAERPDLEAYYRFDGNSIDSSGHGRDGVEFGVAYGPGKAGQSLSLDGGTGYVLAPALNPTGSLTVAAWVSTKGATHGDPQTVVLERALAVDDYCGPESAGTYELQIYGGQFAFATATTDVSGNCIHPRIFASTPIVDDRFYCLVGQFDKAQRTMSLYVDGELAATSPTYAALRTRSDAVMRIGRNHYSVFQTWAGHIDELKFFATVLSRSEIEDYCRGGQLPVANAGANQTVSEGSAVVLDGTASTGADLTYLWEQIAGPAVAVSGSTTATASFDVPALDGGVGGAQTLTFRLTVSSSGESASTTVDVVVTNVNTVPVAVTTPPQTVNEGSLVVLSGHDSYDPDADAVTCVWAQTGGEHVDLENANTCTASFTAPLVVGGFGMGATLEFLLTVSDGDLTNQAATTIVAEQLNHPPTAVTGASQTVNELSPVLLNGLGSSDPDGDALTYEWRQTGVPAVTLDDATSATPAFTAPEVVPGGNTLTFELRVRDGGGLASAPVTTTVAVADVNDPPACAFSRAEPALLWPPNHTMAPVRIVGITDPQNQETMVTITGVAQDEPVNGTGDGDTSPDGVIMGDTAVVRAESSGNGNGRVYTIRFVADDGHGGTCTGSVTVGVPRNGKKETPVDDSHRYDSTMR